MKFVRPLYRSLHNSAVGSGIARTTFIENNEMYILFYNFRFNLFLYSIYYYLLVIIQLHVK